jgi:hypothetical protein
MKFKYWIFFILFVFIFTACVPKTTASKTNTMSRDDINRAKFRSPVLHHIYDLSELVMTGQIVKKSIISPKYQLEEMGCSFWLIEIKVNRIFKNTSRQKLKEGDIIKTYVSSALLNAFCNLDKLLAQQQNLPLTLPNLDRLNNQSICFFKNRSAENIEHLQQYHIDTDDQSWQYDWTDVFFPYYTPIDIHSQDSLWRHVKVNDLAPTADEHRYLKDLLGFPKYPEWQNPRDSYWNKFDPNNKK